MKKLPSSIPVEELLEVIKDNNDNEKPTEHSVLRFLSEFKIEPGQTLTSGNLLYRLYRYNTEYPVSSKEFDLLLTSYLNYEIKNNRNYYLLNNETDLLVKKLAEFLVEKKKVKRVNNWPHRKHFEEFMLVHGLERGTKNIPVHSLYYFYDKWQYSNKLRNRLGPILFTAMIRKYFDTKRTAKISCVVKINESFLNKLTENELKTALEWGKKFREKSKKKTSFKKKTKKS